MFDQSLPSTPRSNMGIFLGFPMGIATQKTISLGIELIEPEIWNSPKLLSDFIWLRFESLDHNKTLRWKMYLRNKKTAIKSQPRNGVDVGGSILMIHSCFCDLENKSTRDPIETNMLYLNNERNRSNKYWERMVATEATYWRLGNKRQQEASQSKIVGPEKVDKNGRSPLLEEQMGLCKVMMKLQMLFEFLNQPRKIKYDKMMMLQQKSAYYNVFLAWQNRLHCNQPGIMSTRTARSASHHAQRSSWGCPSLIRSNSHLVARNQNW